MRQAQVEIAHLWEPLDEIGGDFLYYERVGPRYISLEIGDVTGHGTEAGLVMTALHGLFFGLRQGIAPLDQMLAHANTFLCRLAQDARNDPAAFAQHMMCTMCLLRLDLEKGVLKYCNAGHPAALYLPSGSEDIIPLQSGGPILGVIGSARYQELEMRPEAGDTLLIFTDGLTETCDEQDQEYGVGRLQELLRSVQMLPPLKIVDHVLRAVTEYRGTARKNDDLALAVMQFGPKWVCR
jgi:sigma-B regulation protein RsbU (phosphoserine phosphatase)